MIAIKYRSARRQDEAGVAFVREQTQAKLTKDHLERQGFIVEDVESAAALQTRPG